MAIAESNFLTKEPILRKLTNIMMSSKLLVSISLCCKDPSMHAAMGPSVQRGLQITLHAMQRLTAEAAKNRAEAEAQGETYADEEWMDLINEYAFVLWWSRLLLLLLAVVVVVLSLLLVVVMVVVVVVVVVLLGGL
jgi:hypothetical protein